MNDMDELTQFYYSVYPNVVNAMQKENIDTAWASIVTPQMMIESSWGKDPLVQHNNFFGMKAGKDQDGITLNTSEGYGKNTTRIQDKFLSFPTMEEGIHKGVIRLRDEFNAFEGEPSPRQYVKNINSNPNSIYFTGNPDDYVRNIESIRNGKRAQTATKAYRQDENKRKQMIMQKKAEGYLSQQPDAIRNYRQPVTSSDTRRDAYKAMQDKVNFNRFMDSISIQNTLPPAYEPQSNFHSEGGQMETVKLWEELSIPEKEAMMRVAVKNGITNLQDIKREYNEFAKGGPKKKSASGWYQQHQNRWYNFLKSKGLNDVDSARLSGFFTAQDDLESAGGKSNAAREKNNFGGMQRGGKNIRYNTVEDYMQDKWKMMNSKFKSALGAKNIDEYATILGNPETAGKGYLYYVTDKVKYDPKSSQWKAAQRQHMQNYINGMRSRAGMGTVRFNNQPIASAKPSITPTTPIIPIQSQDSPIYAESPIPFTPFNPEAFFATPDTYQQPIVVEEPEVQEPVTISPYSPEEIDRQERMNRLSTFSKILSLTNPYPQEEDSFLSTINLLAGNTFSKGGGIHIKPENRGKFTALKKRTGHSATWFKEHGTPAQKKMATFALNARKWNHK